MAELGLEGVIRGQRRQTTLLELIADVLALSEDALWAVDINHGGAALLTGLLLSHEQPVVYITGLAEHQASTAYRGQGKTDEKDAFVIADQARMRQDLGPLRPGDEIAVDLRTLTARRLDLANDRTRQTNRLRAQLLEFSAGHRPTARPTVRPAACLLRQQTLLTAGGRTQEPCRPGVNQDGHHLVRAFLPPAHPVRADHTRRAAERRLDVASFGSSRRKRLYAHR
jgi:hypothetical protein